MPKGWISIHRKLQCHWVWEDKPFSRGQAWIDLLMLANHEDSKFLLGNQLVEAKRGEVITSELKLMARWGWSNTKVRSFLNLLEKDSMVIKKTDSKKSAITITNYCVWQDTKSEKEVEEKCKESALEVEKNTINNSNNSNKDIYTIFEFWNNAKVVIHRTMSDKVKGHINARLKDYSVEEICKAIENYSVVVKGEQYYWTHKWGLGDFLLRGLDQFKDESEPLKNFLTKGSGRTEIQPKSSEDKSREILARIREQSRQRGEGK